MERCRFVSSWGGVARCADEVWRDGLCRFHAECLDRGEINDRGLINERLTDQERRRAINYHAIRTASGTRGA